MTLSSHLHINVDSAYTFEFVMAIFQLYSIAQMEINVLEVFYFLLS